MQNMRRMWANINSKWNNRPILNQSNNNKSETKNDFVLSKVNLCDISYILGFQGQKTLDINYVFHSPLLVAWSVHYVGC